MRAKQGTEANIQGHLYAIKTLAELVTEKNGSPTSAVPQVATNTGSYTAMQQPQVVTQSPQPSQPMSLSSQPLPSDDGSNGDSIFDF
ncbi:YwdI family protein [Mangrovibacillus cuniculi]|uniref:YwdI family protein n=2 Tax=Mangrovibacillus cuniculi TaxID=2593652 RepID=A0A7S8HH49_9BACI|nr:YwdI family protein [Mangrovibacillus cuniculi]